MTAPLAPTLSWVKPEVDYALKSVRDNIALFLAKPEESAVLKKCPGQIHQVTGALNILGLYGAVGFCESVEHAFSGITAEPAVRPSAVGTLDRAVLALKEFIDSLAKGAVNAPIKLFPAYREVSNLRGNAEVSEKDLFFPDLMLDAPTHPAAAVVPLDKLPATLLTQRSRFQRGLLAMLRNPGARDGLKDMRVTLEALDVMAAQLPHPRSLWWAAAGLIDGLLRSANQDNWMTGAKTLCSKLDFRMRDLTKGETPELSPLLRDVLFSIAKCRATSTRIREIRQLYQLDSLFPESELPGLMEFDMDWLEPALNEVRGRVHSIKEVWVQYVSGDASALQSLRESVTALKAKIHDLGNVQMIRMIDLIAMVSTRLPDPYPRQSQLMITEMASAFLLIENIVDHFTDVPPDLDKQVEIMGGWLLDSVKGKPAATLPEGLRENLTQEISRLKLQMQVAKEIFSNLQHVEQILDGYARDRSRVNTLSTLPPYLKQIHGALSIIGFDRAAEIQSICNKLIAKCAGADPTWTESDMDTIVEGLSSLGFYLDPCLRGMAPMENVLDAFFERLALRNAPPTAPVKTPDDTLPKPADTAAPLAVAPADQPFALQQPSAQTTPVTDELLDIFLEEAGEVLTAVDDALPACRANVQDLDGLTTIRRGFHTLKGSGRMVGLNELGETAWEIEQVMNHWLDRQWPATPALLELIELATRSFTTWVDQLSARQPLKIEARQLTAMAAALINATTPDTNTPAATPTADAASAPLPEAAVPEQEPDEVVIGTVHVSKMFFEVFRKEAQQHLASLRTEIDAWCSAPGGDASSQLERAAHTLASISRTAELTPPADLAMRLEQCLPNARRVIQPEDLQLLRQSVTALDTMLTDVTQRRYPEAVPDLLAGLDALIERLQSSQASTAQAPDELVDELVDEPAEFSPPVTNESAPAPLIKSVAELVIEPVIEPVNEPVNEPVIESVIEPIDDAALVRAAAAQTVQEQRQIRDDLDTELVPIFLEEALELLPQISRDLRDWKTNPGDPQVPQALQRALHTLKGSARMAGAMRLGELTHLLENRVDAAVAAGAPDMALLEDMEIHVDRLSEGVERLRVHDTPAPDVPAPEHAAAAEPAELLRPDAPLQGAAMLRIHADTLDRLINEAGEVSIARSRIEGELRNIRQSLTELNDSMVRLKGQLREIEVQADSQMQSRQSVMATDRPEFDPLEFDRYTRLQELTRMMSESLHDVTTVQQALLRNAGEVEAAVLQQARGSRELQQGLMRTRTVPFSNLDERLYRIARQTARELGKKINLDIKDSHIELDRSVLERISAPLEHLLRNAISHGIESPESRHASGKSEAGEISISLRQESNEIAIIVRDDGAGLDYEKLRAQGLAQGLLAPQQDAGEEELKALIFAPGFTTAATVTEISGRGVGMDVVRNEVIAIGGHIETLSAAGKGMTFSIFLPLTLAVAQAVLVRSATDNFAISSTMVEQVLSLRPEQLAAARLRGSIEDRGQSYPLYFLQQLLGLPAPAVATQGYSPILLLRSGLQRIALHVDELTRNQEIVIKNINPQLARVAGVTGATVLGDGRVVLIINPVHLTHRTPSAINEAAPVLPAATPPALPLVMVVDDSLTVRKITGRLLEREGYQVMTAKDGLDALEQMHGILPDALLVDIEMPRMDGFDFSSRIRKDARTAAIPIIIISSRTADKHRNRAEQIGVNAFLGKPYQESELLAQVAQYVKPVVATH